VSACGVIYAGPTFPHKHGTRCVREAGHERVRGTGFHWSADGLSWLTAEQKKKRHAFRDAVKP
jgi:hypothetical protein